MTAKSGTVQHEKPAAKRKLGRGLGALMGEARREEPVTTGLSSPARPGSSVAGSASEVKGDVTGLANLPVAAIEPHPDQPRRHFDEDALAELAGSIASRGVIQPVIVRPLVGGRYQIVAGERRWRAAQIAQVHEIPALIRDLEEQEVTALALIENVQREDLNAVEEARAYHRLSEQQGMTQADIAKLVEKSRSHVANLQRLLSLPESVLDHIEEGRLDMGHARALVGHEDAAELAERAVSQSLSVREVERLARKPGGDRQSPRRAREPRDPETTADLEALQRDLEEFLGLPVKIAVDANQRRGSVTVRYRTLDQLDLVCQRLTGRGI